MKTNHLHVAGDKYLMLLGTVVLQKCISALKAFLLIRTSGGTAESWENIFLMRTVPMQEAQTAYSVLVWRTHREPHTPGRKGPDVKKGMKRGQGKITF